MVCNRARAQGGHDGGHLDRDTRFKLLLIIRRHRVDVMDMEDIRAQTLN